jgi:DNA-binding transcriptional MerR regulator
MTKIKYSTPGKKTKRKTKPAAKSANKLKVIKPTRPRTKLILREETATYVVNNPDLITLEEVARITGKTTHNIRDYIQRGRIAKLDIEGQPIKRAENGELRVSLKEVQAFLYLVSQRDEKHQHAGLHPDLGFYGLAERERTKHVNRLHPYLGKFIPQLVEWFLNLYFKKVIGFSARSWAAARRWFKPTKWVGHPLVSTFQNSTAISPK